jgi:hypothetical protein
MNLEIDASVIPEISWNPSTKRYYFEEHGKKKAIPAKAVEKLTELHITDSSNKLTKLANELIDGKISLLSWQIASKQTLKELHLANMLLARGGKKNIRTNDYLAVGRILKVEYRYFQQFAKDIQRGYSTNAEGVKTYMTKARLLDRVKKYALSSKVSFEKGIEINMSETGFTHCRRYLNSRIPCPTCPEYAHMGLQLIGKLPLPKTQCVCGSRCRCSIKYFKGKLK